MKPRVLTILLLGLILLQDSCQTKEPVELTFIRYTNAYDTLGLKTVLAEDFVMERTYSPYKNDYASFLQQYLTNAESANGKMQVIDRKTVKGAAELKIRNSSDIFTYLGITEPVWHMRFSFNEKGKIQKLLIDTTDTYHVYKRDIVEKEDRFEQWLKGNYPGESLVSLAKSKGKWKKRLLEYKAVAN